MPSFDAYITDKGARPGDTTVMVAMSGGVDSSVAAALLVEAGYRVVGATLKLWCLANDDGGAGRCCSAQSLDDARAVCRTLGIPHYVIDLSSEFERKVVEPFCSEYLAGRTPNPCVECNTKIKFGDFMARAKGTGADYVATGHHVRQGRDPATGKFWMKRGVDSKKDQSYALWGLTQPVLQHTAFPIGWLTKEEVRERAKSLDLVVAEKQESQDVCFIPEGDVAELFEKIAPRVSDLGRRQIRDLKGEIRNLNGEIVGYHNGYFRFTVGQRRGLGVAAGRPQYVTRVDPAENVVYVGDDYDLKARTAHAQDFNFISDEPPISAKLNLSAKIRYLHPAAPGTLEPVGRGAVRFTFDELQRAITPGQSLAVYDEDRLLGGGVIDGAEP